jgi:hypothetical protein
LAVSAEGSPPGPVPTVPRADHRDLRLDACRGLALWFIFLDHVPNNLLSWLTLRNYGFSDTTEIFFFVSGYTCMIAYGGALLERGWRTTITRALRRGWEIYVAFLLLLLAYLALVQSLGGGTRVYLDGTNTGVFFDFPAAAIIHTMTMQYMPVNTDVLPPFVLLHLLFPALLWLLRRSATIALAASFALYLAVQLFNWNLPAWPRGEWFFNPLAWQVLFVFGAWVAMGGAAWLRPLVRSTAALTLAILYIAFSLAVALSWHLHALEAFMPEILAKLIYPVDKSHLAPVRLLHFLALALVVARLVRHDWRGLASPVMTALIRCGENSLAIYCLGVLLTFAAQVMLNRISAGIPMQVAVSLAGIGVMIAAATVMTWTARLDRNRPKLF